MKETKDLEDIFDDVLLEDDEIVDEKEDVAPLIDPTDKDEGIEQAEKGNLKILTPVFLLVDTSGSMDDKDEFGNRKIDKVQEAVRNIADQLVKYQYEASVILRISIICFDDKVYRLYTNQDPSNLLNVTFNLGGCTYMGESFIELEKMLHREVFADTPCSQYKRAVAILLTDGHPNGAVTPEEGVKVLRKNNWFVTATRIAFAIGKEGSVGLAPLELFTGAKKAIIKTENLKVLANLLEALTIKASKTASMGPNATLDSEMQSALDEKFANSARDTVKIIKASFEDTIIKDDQNNVDTGEIEEIFELWKDEED